MPSAGAKPKGIAQLSPLISSSSTGDAARIVASPAVLRRTFPAFPCSRERALKPDPVADSGAQSALLYFETRFLESRVFENQAGVADRVAPVGSSDNYTARAGTWVESPSRFSAVAPLGWIRQLNLRANARAT